MKRIYWVLLAIMLSGCGSVSPATSQVPHVSPSPASSPSPAASPSPRPASSPTPKPSAFAGACWPYRGGQYFRDKATRPSITDVRVGRQGTYDRLTVEFTNVGLPNYEMMPNQISPGGGTTFIEDPRGTSITVQGNYGVQLKIFDTDWTNDRFASGRDLTPEYPVLKEVRVTGDYEAIASIAIGLNGNICPIVTEMTSPPGLVIDFPIG